ncbi:hypothetical protein EXU57_03865 [Segetibacter sp. 3557_3]|uniref:hypothetical protein n=1 Tax=Segetibacter sp. 3557_3 TaxID=2547429 RepID=UPI001058D4F7|nr:hypothetical protein [Segetibacter sp. 3557_3]TDH29213.1 hypothetical protein EXU57_03865 [Segetibacter sp. 3557_3]
MKRILIIMAFVVGASSSYAQTRNADSSKKTVVVTSSYKPVLKPVTKINFNATAPALDSSRPILNYNVPSQNLFFSYQPVALKPLALAVDSTLDWENHNYVKAGYGNFSTPYLQAKLSLGDGKGSIMNLHTKHISSKGKIPFQQYSRSSAVVDGVLNSSGNNEWRGSVGFENSTQHWYGYRPDTLKFTKDQLKQTFSTFHANAGFRNREKNAFGIDYNPSLGLNLFGDNRGGKETSLLLNAPITKTVAEDFSINVGLVADLTSYSRGSGENIKNNLYYLNPSLLIKKPTITVNAGVTPSWDNSQFKLLPNFTGVLKLPDYPFAIQAGWIGYYNKNTFQSLAAFNPYIFQPTELLNTRITEQYAGFKGSGGNHFTYNVRLSALRYSNAALFINDSIDGKTFRTVYEPSMKAIRLHGEMGYTVQDKFSLLGAINLTNYRALEVYDKAFGLLPVEVTAGLRWQILKDLQWKSDFFFWDGPQYMDKNKNNRKQKPAVDLSTGLEFTILPKLSLWLQFNNLLNNRYERWNQYEVLGFNVLGGVVYSFSQGKK